MKLQPGTFYMASIGDWGNPVLGVVVARMWWKPWRFFVQPVYYRGLGGSMVYGEPLRNLTKLGVVGAVKLFGVEHRDFETFEGELK
jgi:hypothetical protein